MRKSYVQVNGVLYEKGTEPEGSNAPMVMPDIKPYKSMVTGEIIDSRSKHRSHLKAHGMVEVGNEKLKPHSIPDVAPQQRKELIRTQIASMTEKQFQQMRKRDLDNIRWNSRQD